MRHNQQLIIMALTYGALVISSLTRGLEIVRNYIKHLYGLTSVFTTVLTYRYYYYSCFADEFSR